MHLSPLNHWIWGRLVRLFLISCLTIGALGCVVVVNDGDDIDGDEDSSALVTAERNAMLVMDKFLAAFNARDEAAWADTLHFPHVRISSQQVVITQTRSDFLQNMDLDEFAASTGWRYSTWDEREVVQSDPEKVHIAVVFSRYNADDQKFATFDSLYIVERINGRWAIRARSSFAP